jgi:hypothetical protein
MNFDFDYPDPINSPVVFDDCPGLSDDEWDTLMDDAMSGRLDECEVELE